jgi:alkylated DNA repair dioxygenase AlkB
MRIQYGYSGYQCVTQKASPNLLQLLSAVNEQFPGADYNAILVNRYTDGSQYISPHADDERNLDPTFGVLTISVGAQRVFQIRDKKTKKLLAGFPTLPNSMLQMVGRDFQQNFLHGIRKDKSLGTRWSFTFRKHVLPKHLL